ncbi:MAG TPA: phosphate signaling complex protein PhoU [Rubricoccaceae bacterium]|jgi:phosphate transport system protein|nr:phosphate signaling complex protein PhoU [Rubricoccaceae bacterium]
MPVHRPLDEELQILWDLLVQMHLLVDEQLADAIDAVTRCDADKAARVRDRDDEVDRLELEVDHQCERILALHTPVAVDLRLLVTAVKINTDLERIGDHAKNLAKYTPYLAGRSDLVEQAQLGRMADAARAILREAQDAFMKRDRMLARRVIGRDREVDALHEQAFQRVVALLKENPADAEALVHLVTMSKGVERIADHAKNIAETVVFLIEGVDVRHRRLQQRPEAAA